jgi:hypothetical protein
VIIKPNPSRVVLSKKQLQSNPNLNVKLGGKSTPQVDIKASKEQVIPNIEKSH